MITGLGKAAFRAIGSSAPKIPWIDLGKTRGSKPRMVGTIRIPFWKNPRDGFSTGGSAKTKGVKPSMASMACPFFEAGAPESIGDFVISSITTEVEGAGGTLHKCSHKYSSQSFLDSIVIVLWLVPAWVFRGHRLATMQSLLRTTSLLIQIIPWLAKL